jgi:hypothetical protein
MPENANGEVVLGSFYRYLGLAPSSEIKVGDQAKVFKQRIDQGYLKNGKISPSGLNDNEMHYLIANLLQSPRLKNQGNKNIHYVTPIVPVLANYGAVARYKGNPWNPGAYLGEMIARGCAKGKADSYLDEIRQALLVNYEEGKENNDDIWSRFADQELKIWDDFKEKESNHPDSKPILLSGTFPSKRICNDLIQLIQLKSKLTRKKWISLIESYLRLIITIDLLWYCHVQTSIIQLVEKNYKEDLLETDIDSTLTSYNFFEISLKRPSLLEIYIREYVKSSFLLKRLDNYCVSNHVACLIDLNPAKILEWIKTLKSKLSSEKYEELKLKLMLEIDKDQDAINQLSISQGTPPNNLLEALTYIPGKRNTVEASKSAYDQGYWNNKIGKSWIFEPGPVSLSVMVYICCNDLSIDIISARDFIEFLKFYGISTDEKELSVGMTGRKLRRLGYVIDSPDMEGGILIRKPF